MSTISYSPVFIKKLKYIAKNLLRNNMMEVHPGGNTHIPAQSHISFAICLTVIIKKSLAVIKTVVQHLLSRLTVTCNCIWSEFNRTSGSYYIRLVDVTRVFLVTCYSFRLVN